ncbi:universal stress protein [Halolamina sp. C58]|uniref:universal stress protein n=1 Tax=Halolamina sp. C58 TaxID=3421640 RepID=UPI003EBBBB9B
MYDDVLLPVALGEAEDDPAVGRAVDLAAQYDATLHLVSAIDPAVFDPMTVETEQLHEALEEEAEAAVETAAERAEERGLDVESRVGRGPAASVIVDAAEAVDVVVMATHGREGLQHALLGSVTEKVVRHSPAPVLTVPR